MPSLAVKKRIKVTAGILLGAVLLWLLFRDTDWPEVWRAVRAASWGWLALMQAGVLVSFVLRVQRWAYIVRAVRTDVSFRQLFSATQIGFLGNFTLPGRMGEFIRALVLGRQTGIPFAQGVALVALDRVTDLFGLIAVLLVAAFFFRPESVISIPGETFGTTHPLELSPHIISWGAMATAAFLVAILCALVVLFLAQDRFIRLTRTVAGIISSRLAEKASQLLLHFAEGLHVFRSGWDMARALTFSLLLWGSFLLVYQCVFRAFGVEGPWYMVFVAQALLALAVSVPGAPGFVGQFHVAVVVSVAMLSPNTTGNEAKAVALVAHLGNLIPVAVAGIACLMAEHVSLFELKRESEQLQAGTEGPD